MKNRVDKELVERGLINSRAKAQELIENGLVKCNGKIVTKSNTLVDEQDLLEILDNDLTKYVSRGGLKLEEAINKFNIDFTGLKVMDIGSSTGGFCDCALKHRAKSIIAVDVGTDVMVESLRNDPRIDLHEQTNFKELDSKYFKDIDIITCDVSFISLKPIIKKVYDEKIKIDMICLIKPRFECGMEIANKYGMMQPGASSTQAVRAVFVIDPEGKIRTILYYPLTTGRNFDEIYSAAKMSAVYPS